jgi:CheY-like chemotaxis protein
VKDAVNGLVAKKILLESGI